jgi:nitrite reductase (cytochrome c-552)
MRSRIWLLVLAAVVVGVAIGALLVSIVTRQQQARLTYFPVAQVTPDEPDPAVWGRNFPYQYERLTRTLRTAELEKYSKYGRYGGSEAFSKLEQAPDLERIFAGNAFSVEYREERGHLSALKDVQATKRLGDAKPGPCLTCKSSQVPGLMRTISPRTFYDTPMKDLVAGHNIRFAIGCADCHDSATMSLRISRPAFREAMARRGINVNAAGRQEMRTYVCAQCHVEYYWPSKTDQYLIFPWDKGLRLENIEAYYDERAFADYTHAITGAAMVKMQHPEFELWSSGIHARSGVACADCHMPYTRVGSVKMSDHWVRTPLADVARSCLGCHRESEAELRARVLEAQERTYQLLRQAERAIADAINAIEAASASGAGPDALAVARAEHRKAQARWDFISAENSMGFHSPQEAVRILGDAIDHARRAELAAERATLRR